MTPSETSKRPHFLWRFFSSVRLTIVLLIMLAAASILGTLIPQRGQGAMEFSRSLSPEVFKVLQFFDLFDMYHSIWFRVLLACFALNLIICSLNRFPGTWRRFKAVPRADRKRPLEDLSEDQVFTAPAPFEEVVPPVVRLLRARYKRTQQKDGGDTTWFYGEKGRYSHFGVYLIHVSVLIILTGGLVGSLFGFEAFVNIPEGVTVDTVTLRKGMKPHKLGFEVRCNDFEVQFYENGMPKEYRSELTFLRQGKAVAQKSVRVNHPARFQGVTFYQSTYGQVPGRRVRLAISRKGDHQKRMVKDLDPQEAVALPGGEGRLKVVDIKADFMRMGPAVLVSITSNQGGETRFWVFQKEEQIRARFPGIMERFPKLNPAAFSPYTIFLDNMESVYYTGLQVNKDPGVSLVWVGCFVMVAGFFATFFTSHKRIWVRISREARGTQVSVAGSASKNPVGLQRELEHLTKDLIEAVQEKA